MIEIYNSSMQKIGSFNNYNDVYRYISYEENMKLFDDHPEFGKIPWSFIVHSPERIAIVHHNARKRYDMDILKEAFEKEVSLLEICKGDYQNLIQIPITRNINVEKLKKDWCEEYCKAHGYRIVEREG
jgi:hypothetical protein